MPAIQVAKTDTFERQRQKINDIGTQIFNISAGGSDLSTGLLKIGDGTRLAPSLAFSNDVQVGVYRPANGVFGIVSNAKNIFDFSNNDVFSYRDLVFRKKVLANTNLSLASSGSSYDPGSYTGISVLGGSGDLGTLDIVVTEFVGTITNAGQNYNPGSFSNISLDGGNGSGATVNFVVDPINGTITNAGSLYAPGQYLGVALQNGSGSSATADITITGSATITGSVGNAGSAYTDGTYSNIKLRNVPANNYVVTSVANPGTPPPNNVYQINGITQQALSLTKGNTYTFDISSATLSSHPFELADSNGVALDFQYYIVNKVGSEGTAGSFVELTILPGAATETIQYYCANHTGMGANMTVSAGSAGNYGSGAQCSFEVASGAVTNFSITTQGSNYKAGDTVSIAAFDIGGTGSGFLYNIQSITYTGTVTNVNIVSSGQDYALGDVLTANDSDLGGGGGSGFLYTVETSPGVVKNLDFTSKGSAYQTNDILTLPTGVTGVTGDFKIDLSGVAATLTSGSLNVTVASTTGIYAGMTVTTASGSTGDVAPQTTVATVVNATTFTLSQNATASGAANLNFAAAGSQQEVVVSSVSGINAGDIVTVTSGSGTLPANTTVSNINQLNTSITLSNTPTAGGPVTLSFVPGFGSGTTSFAYQISALGAVESFLVNNAGNGYNQGDIISVSPNDLIQPITYAVKAPEIQTFTFTTTVASSFLNVGDFIDYDDGTFVTSSEIISKTVSGSNIDTITVIGNALSATNVVVKQGTTSPQLTINTIETGFKFLIDTGSGFEITPNLTLYVGSTYAFDLSDASNSSHTFALSQFRDGIHAPSKVENVSTTFATASKVITVSSTTGILAGMEIEKVSGDGEFLPGTIVESVDSATQITLSQNPTTAGAIILNFKGTEYTDGVTRSGSSLTVKVTSTTPTPLYYFCSRSGTTHENMGGSDNSEATITIDPNNPKTFGSGFQVSVDQSSSTDSVSIDIIDGIINTADVKSTTATIPTLNSTSFTSDTVTSNSVTTDSINASGDLSVISTTNFVSDLSVGSNFSVTASNGSLTTSGVLRSNNSLNINGRLSIIDNTISSIGSYDLVLSPAGGRLTQVAGTSAFVIPVGTSAERPTFGVGAGNGAIRFNTVNGQYEGYNSTTTSWSSLGGVRDIDGNTYILAELTAGANDNTLWFYNDAQNTLQLTTQRLDFRSVKTISSTKLGLPAFTVWAANTPVQIGDYVKYRNNLYEVTAAGTTGSAGTEPTHESGAQNNGTAQLTWSQLAVSPLIFDDIQEVRIGPNKNCPLIIGQDLTINENTISTQVQDLVIQPNAGKQVIVNSVTHFRIPAGNNNQKSIAAPGPGSIRFNTQIQQYEGYSGTNWSSLGGVRDVDGNTYIIPESAPAANENILYFYNNNVNTIQLTETALDFTGIDTVTTTSGNSLAIETEVFTLNSNDTTVDNSDATRTFIHTSKQYLDLGLSSGLNVDPVLRLDNQGDVYLNTTFGTGSFNGVKILDGDLKEFELADYKIKSSTFTLDKGGLESSAVVLYPSGTSKGCKVTVVSKSSSGKRSMSEYAVIDNGTDIFHNEYASLNSSDDQYTAAFDFTASTEPRITLTLTNDHATSDVINFTVLVQEIK